MHGAAGGQLPNRNRRVAARIWRVTGSAAISDCDGDVTNRGDERKRIRYRASAYVCIEVDIHARPHRARYRRGKLPECLQSHVRQGIHRLDRHGTRQVVPRKGGRARVDQVVSRCRGLRAVATEVGGAVTRVDVSRSDASSPSNRAYQATNRADSAARRGECQPTRAECPLRGGEYLRNRVERPPRRSERLPTRVPPPLRRRECLPSRHGCARGRGESSSR